MGARAVGARALLFVCSTTVGAHAQATIDSSLAAYIAAIRAVDNHAHVNSVVPVDSEYDALPLDGLSPFAVPDRLRGGAAPIWLAAYRALYGYTYDDLSDAHMNELRATMKNVAREQGARFPEWVLDRIGTEVVIANRIAMGPGLAPPRFRWASYVDPLMLPLSTAAERTSPDYRALYPLEEKLLGRYMSDLRLTKVPATFDAYLRNVVTATLERQRQGGCVAVKFEVAYLRALDFADASIASARSIYARYAGGGSPTHAEYKTLQDYLFRYIAREAGRLGMAVHIHSLEGAGGYYRAAGSDPLLLEPTFNDSTLRGTNFVIVHGGGMYAAHANAMLWKPNVYVDISLMTVVNSPATLAPALRTFVTQFPDKVLFGSDAFGGGPDAGWELTAWIGSHTARQALATVLTAMMRDGEITRQRAEEIATMVLRGNALKLYDLKLN